MRTKRRRAESGGENARSGDAKNESKKKTCWTKKIWI